MYLLLDDATCFIFGGMAKAGSDDTEAAFNSVLRSSLT